MLLSPLPTATRAAFKLISTLPIPRNPLDELIAGFKTDLKFHSTPSSLPILTQADLYLYSSNVASSVAELCVRLVWMNEEFDSEAITDREGIIKAAREMGIALQLVNIARDVGEDLKIGRIYLPGFA